MSRGEIKFRIEADGPPWHPSGKPYLIVECANAASGHCITPLTRGTAEKPYWRWNGDAVNPTISPSIDCTVCGRHFTITDGVSA